MTLAVLCTQPTPRTAAIAALNEFSIESGSVDGAQGTVSFAQRYSDGSVTVWEGRLMRLDNVVDPSSDTVSLRSGHWVAVLGKGCWALSRATVFDGYSELTLPRPPVDRRGRL